MLWYMSWCHFSRNSNEKIWMFHICIFGIVDSFAWIWVKDLDWGGDSQTILAAEFIMVYAQCGAHSIPHNLSFKSTNFHKAVTYFSMYLQNVKSLIWIQSFESVSVLRLPYAHNDRSLNWDGIHLQSKQPPRLTNQFIPKLFSFEEIKLSQTTFFFHIFSIKCNFSTQ